MVSAENNREAPPKAAKSSSKLDDSMAVMGLHKQQPSSKAGWRSLISAIKHQFKILSPIRCLTVTRDSYVRGMTNFAAKGNYGAMVQGPHIAGLSRSASRNVAADNDDLYQLIRAASRKNADLGMQLPRSASVQEKKKNGALEDASYPRSASDTRARFPVHKTILESTQEE